MRRLGQKASRSLLYDPDGARGLGIVHWILYGIPAATTALGEGGPPPAGSIGGINRTGKDGYYGPCPPHGDAPHHYVVQAYALDLAANALPAALDRDALIAAMKGHVLASSSMVVRYARDDHRPRDACYVAAPLMPSGLIRGREARSRLHAPRT